MVVRIELSDEELPLVILRFFQALVPTSDHVTRREKLLVVGVAFLVLVHVDISHLRSTEL